MAMHRLLFNVSRIAFCILIIVLASVAVSAQFKASIQGTVTDSNGAVVRGAKITVVNKGTGRELTVVTSDSGFYRLAGLPPGEYQVFAEHEGFKKRELQTVRIGAETEQ